MRAYPSTSDHLQFGLRKFHTAFWFSMFAVSVQCLIFLIPGIINRRYQGEMGGFFVIPSIFTFYAVTGIGAIIWNFGFNFLRFVSRLFYFVFGRNRVEFTQWDRVFCRSLWPLPWAFGIGAIAYIAYFSAEWGGWPDDVIVGTIGNLLGAFCYVTIFYNWFRLCQKSKDRKPNSEFGADQ